MKEFIEVSNKTFYFGDCDNCNGQCCSGLYGSTFSQILLDEFEKVYEIFPILFIFGELNYAKAVILLTDGINYCPYLKDSRCTIYEKRPSVCRTYPLSPNIDNKIYIDNACPEINPKDDKKSLIIKDQILTKEFDNPLFDNYLEKYIDTHTELEKLDSNNFKKILTLKNVDFFIYEGDTTNKYINFHKASLENLNNL